MVLVSAKGHLILPAILPESVDQELERALIAVPQPPSPCTKPTVIPAWFVSFFLALGDSFFRTNGGRRGR